MNLKKLEIALFLSKPFVGHIRQFLKKSKFKLSNQFFSQTFGFVFGSKLKNVYKHALIAFNCIMPLLTPLNVQFKKNIFFKKHTLPSSEMEDLFQRWHLKYIQKKNHGFEKSGALQITILQKVGRSLAFWGKWVGNHSYMAKWTLIYEQFHQVYINYIQFRPLLWKWNLFNISRLHVVLIIGVYQFMALN